ncbi:MAG: hypothetical protein COB51_04230 [Moraxellaceae bacterium]|nr:MAG: hypothetical protein COB51_04230 [Moraxellaceae bacterium]
MIAEQLIEELSALDIKLSYEDERLRFDAPKGAMNDGLLKRLKINKLEIISFLKQRAPHQDSQWQEQPIAIQSRSQGLPLSSAQQRFWFLDQLDRGNSAAFVMAPIVLNIKGDLNVEALEKSLLCLVQRHEVLRSAFRIESEQPVQIFLKDVHFNFKVTDLSLQGTVQATRIVADRVREEATTAFVLDGGEVLMRTQLLKLNAKEHVFILTLHHIIADGWSIGILVEELSHYYRSFTEGSVPDLDPLPIQYADYCYWENQRLKGDYLNQHIEFWQAQLANAPQVLALPTDHLRPPIRTNRGELETIHFDPKLSQPLNALCKAQAVTPFMVLLSAYAVLLCRFTDQEDIVIGSPIAVRPHSATEGLIGVFLNTLVLRVDLTGNPSFSELLKRVRAMSLAAFEHSEMPFEKLLQALEVERHLDHTPLFQVLFTLQNAPLGEISLDGLSIETQATQSPYSPFDMTLSLEESEQGIHGFFRYSCDLFEAHTVQRWRDQLLCLTTALITEPDTPVRFAPLLPPAEKQLLALWRGGEKHFVVNQTLHQAFEAQVKIHSNRIALSYLDQQLSYQELDTKANQVAHRLRREGVDAGTRVGLCAERSMELVIGLLGILKAGGVYVPLDPSSPPQRLQIICDNAELDLVLTYCVTIPVPKLSVPKLSVRQIHLQDASLSEEIDYSPELVADPQRTAYVIYTSGSTGRPKGVEVSHANVMRLFLSSESLFKFNCTDVWCMFHSYAFDFSVWELWGGLLHGAEVVIVPHEHTRSPQLLIELIQQRNISFLNQTPSAFQQLMVADQAQISPMSSLKNIVFGGEALDLKRLTPWVDRYGFNSPKLFNMYGITETTVHTTVKRIFAEDVSRGISTIGVPLSDVSIELRDRYNQLVPIGVKGEIIVGGGGVAKGYLNLPDKTASSFSEEDVSLSNKIETLYHSGDAARWLADGQLEYINRIDLQVKIRGFRIELGEIESRLEEHALVECAIVDVRDREHGAQLVAYLCLNSDSNLSSNPNPDSDVEDNIRRSLSAKLPGYMIPAKFIRLDSLPLTHSGKVDRKALSAIEIDLVTGNDNFPSTERECYLAHLFAEVLDVERVSLDDDFFKLGGDSIRGVILINKLQHKLSQVIHVVAIFEAPTVAKLVLYLNQQYPQAMNKLGPGGDAVDGLAEKLAENVVAKVEDEPIDESTLREFQQRITPLPLFTETTPKNPRAIFVLSPPRSGSTLLRVLLGGHPSLFSPPELELLGYDTLGQRAQAHSEGNAFWSDGVLRALMELRGFDADQAKQMMRSRENKNQSVKTFYGDLQSWMGEKILVDKSPSYALDLSVLQRAEAYFDKPLYIHLHRHPYGMIRSFGEAHLDQIFYRYPHDYSVRRLAELIWTQSHRNIAEFLSDIPLERQTSLSFEDMTRDPQGSTLNVCNFIGIDYDPQMLQLYNVAEKSNSARMTDGPHKESRMLGDVKFHGFKKIDATVADSWKTSYEKDFLSGPAWQTAESLNYIERIEADSFVRTLNHQRVENNKAELSDKEIKAVDFKARDIQASGIQDIVPTPRGHRHDHSDSHYALSFAQQRLWFLDQLDGASTTYSMPVALRLKGEVDKKGLADAFSKVIQRHEVLRSRFDLLDGEPVVRLLATVPGLEFANLRGATQENIQHRLRHEAEQCFDLNKGPLLRSCLFELGDNEHILFFNMHHIISDGWSMGILIKEWCQYYNQLEEALLPLPVQYIDYAQWQRQYLTAEVLSTQLNYWRETLLGAADLLALPTDRPRPAIQQYQGATLDFSMNGELTRALNILAEREGVSLYMLLLSVFGILLSRHSGQNDIVIGSPSANRFCSEVEPLIGFFVNTLVLRLEVNAADHFDDYLKSVRQLALNAFAHQDVSFEQLVEALQPQRSLSYSPLFQVMFSLQNAPSSTPELKDLNLEAIALSQVIAKYDLSLSVTEVGGKLQASFEYNTDLFDRSTIQRMSGHFRNLLVETVASPQKANSALQLMDPQEKVQLLGAVDRPSQKLFGASTMHGLFEQQVLRSPKSIAVVCGRQQLSYQALNDQASHLARQLISKGLRPGDLVALGLERSVRIPMAMLAVLKAGAAYVPLDPSYPKERIQFVLQDAEVALLLTESSLQADFPQTICPFLCLDQIEDEVCPEVELPEISENQLAYVIYTSGSTGKPKGVMISHGAAANFLQAMRLQPGLKASDKLLAVTTVAFDIAVLELFLPLLVGAQVCIADQGASADGQALIELMQQQDITVMQATPATWRMLLALQWPGQNNLKILCGGEALSTSLAGELITRCDQLWNMYGPTEATVWATVHEVKQHSLNAGLVSIGQPIANMHSHILDCSGNLQPLGVIGDLYLSGVGLAQGYWGREALTKTQFLYSDVLDRRVYKTGDKARYLANGDIEYLGRDDQQVKVRGYRIEIGEVEGQLLKQAVVNQCAVVVEGSVGETTRLVAFCVFKRNVDFENNKIINEKLNEEHSLLVRRALQNCLPDYMVPSVFIALAELPLTPNGKIDRKALLVNFNSTPLNRGSVPGSERVGFRDQTEQTLVQIWADVLGLPWIGIKDDFFVHGGHSLLAVKLVAKISAAFNRPLSLASLFQAPTVEAMACLLRDPQRDVDDWHSIVGIQTQGDKTPFYCAAGAGGNVVYFHPLATSLGMDRPFYGLQPPGLDGCTAPLTTVEALASHYLDGIKESHGDGPVLLGGHSFGGIVAYEMARQLSVQNKPVSGLILLDTPAPQFFQPTGRDWSDTEWLSQVSEVVSHLYQVDVCFSVEALNALPAEQRLARLHQALIANEVLPVGSPIEFFRGFIDVYKANLSIQYQAKRIESDLKVLLVRAEREQPKELTSDQYDQIRGSEDLGWRDYFANKIDVVDVPGDHLTMMRNPHVEDIAAVIEGLKMEFK